MFKTFDKNNTDNYLKFEFDGKPIKAKVGMSVAAALLAEGIIDLRQTPVSGSIRGPFCMMGACYDCLVLIDDISVQACTIPVRDGLVVSRVPIVTVDE